MPIRLFFFLLFALLLQCCGSRQKEPFASMLRPCDGVDIILYNGGDTLSYETRDTAGVRIFVQLISGSTRQPADTCAAAGELRYKWGTQLLLTAPFSLPGTGGKDQCNYVTYQAGQVKYLHPLTPRAHNLLKQVHALPQENQ